MALSQTIATARKFADDTNTLATIIQSQEFYSDGYFHYTAMKLAVSYRQTDIQGLLDAIWNAVDDIHSLQGVFDLWKQQLNTIALPNYDFANFKAKFDRQPYIDDALDIFQTLLDVCGDLKRETAYFMQENQLVDSKPKIGFLCPLFYEDDKLATEEETSQQKAPNEGVASTTINIPKNLQEYQEQIDTDRARKYIPLAVKDGLIEQTQQGYRKGKRVSKALLAYFLQKVYVDAVSGAVFPDTALNILFGESNLKNAVYALSNNKNGYGKPRGYRRVDAIIDEA